LKATITEQRTLIEKLEKEKDELTRVHEDLKRQQAESEEDLERSEKRLKMVIADLEGKLEFENDSTNKLKTKIEQLEKDYMNSKIQLGEMKKTIMEYESKLKHKEAEAVGLENQKSMVVKEKETNLKRTKELEIQIESLDQQLADSRGEIQQHISHQQAISKELDETRALLETKCSEEHMMSQVTKAREEELTKFREQQNQLLGEMSEIKRQGNQAVADIKSERDEVRRQFESANQAHKEATEFVVFYILFASQSKSVRYQEGRLSLIFGICLYAGALQPKLKKSRVSSFHYKRLTGPSRPLKSSYKRSDRNI
jgi:chromosome segregation ATPase